MTERQEFNTKCHLLIATDLLRHIATDNGFVNCHEMSETPYCLNKCRMFLDSSKRSQSRALLLNGNLFGEIPIGHTEHVKE